MEIGVKEAAKLLNVSEKMVYKWIKHKSLPAFKLNEQYKLNRAELLEWATLNHINISADLFHNSDENKVLIPNLEEAIRAGGIYYQIDGSNKISVLKAIVDLMPLPKDVDKTFLFQVLMAREGMGSTGIGDGIAIPHVRNPIVMHIASPMITVCFLKQPIDFGALDGKPVHTLFTIISPVISTHLNLLSKLAFALRQPLFEIAIKERKACDKIYNSAREIDQVISSKDLIARKEK
ncbi:MAG: PTS fructose transporter subunit IIA [Deltaproteobacteria bacterium CG07_land_8_20_14_0_80_38_7]|nr:MAG: PTS fructose transporter subunit IIA [Deltaproteobacteria bacterium CG07_land_8_20_14_0_80_38_7]